MEKEYDLFLFLGQSNMAGRGITSQQWPEAAPTLIPGAGYEYRAISDPERLHAVKEPFGVNENNPDGIYEPGRKTGSMVTAFINAYYTKTGIPVIGVSASKGGSAIGEWQGNRDYLSDGDLGTSSDDYKAGFKNMFAQFKEKGIETCFLITIGKYNGEREFDYSKIRQTQLEIAAELPDVELVCDDFHTMRVRSLMKDEFHYYQKAYNEVGTAAGNAAGEFVNGL